MPSLKIQKLSAPKGRILILGDVHGCLEELEWIIDAFGPKPKDLIISVGDLINRGPDSRGVLKLARKLNIHPVLGNHEQRLLQAWKDKDTKVLKSKDMPTYKQLKKADWEWIQHWPHVIQIPELNILVVHGGFHPGRKWKKQLPEEVTTIQVLDSEGKAARKADAPKGVPWATTWRGPKHVYYGHTPRPNPVINSHSTGLDTGCVYGYSLSAICLPDNEIYQIEADRPYADD